MRRRFIITVLTLTFIMISSVFAFAVPERAAVPEVAGQNVLESLWAQTSQVTSLVKVTELLTNELRTYDSSVARVPVLMYHHISVRDSNCTSPDKFRRDMEGLKEAGYETISYDDLYDFVNGDKVLPLRPVIITFDDGYMSNYEEAYPVLKELNMKAEISVVGETSGQNASYGNSVKIIPHFTWEQADVMYRAGVFKFRSHSYGLHSHSTTGNVTRNGVMQNEGETDDEYTDLLIDDCKKMEELITQKLGYDNNVFTYPYGSNNKLTEKILKNCGYDITVTVNPGINTVRKGDPSTLRMLERVACDGYGGTAASLIEYYDWAYE